jgi:hypothetical protein
VCVQAPAGPRPPRQHRATASAGRGTNKYQQTRRETATHERERPKGHPRAWESAQRPPRACSAALSTFGRALCYLRVGPQQRASRPPKRRFLVRRLQPPSSPERRIVARTPGIQPTQGVWRAFAATAGARGALGIAHDAETVPPGPVRGRPVDLEKATAGGAGGHFRVARAGPPRFEGTSRAIKLPVFSVLRAARSTFPARCATERLGAATAHERLQCAKEQGARPRTSRTFRGPRELQNRGGCPP